jgi:hypothetical protein
MTSLFAGQFNLGSNSTATTDGDYIHWVHSGAPRYLREAGFRGVLDEHGRRGRLSG